jgi:hypothetical protein
MRYRHTGISVYRYVGTSVYRYTDKGSVQAQQGRMMIGGSQTSEKVLTKCIQVHFTDTLKPVAGHYVNKHTRRSVKKRKMKEEEEEAKAEAEARSLKDSATLTYNLLYIPRILKSDLRRQYPVMFMNVFNSCNRDVINGFAEKFFRDDTQFILEAPSKYRLSVSPQKSNASLARYIPVKSFFNGKENCKNLWFDRMNDAPDLRFEVTSVRIKVRSDGTSSCYATYKYSGTSLMHIDPTRLTQTLHYCKENDDGILSFPYPIQTSLDSTETCLPNNPPKLSLLDGFDDDFIEIAQEIFNKWKHISTSASSSTSTQHKMFQFLINRLLLRRFVRLHNIPKGESDYLIEVAENKIILNNTLTRPNETLQLAFPFHFGGDFIFHLDDESKIVMNEMRTYLVARDSLESIGDKPNDKHVNATGECLK